jgi:soluble lytic murein transglycosylase-like protein
VRLIMALAFCSAIPAQACWDEAAARYQVSSTLLRAIARTESGLNPLAIGRNRDGTRDIGLMQINSAWLPVLAAHGISERDLFDPCTNIQVGAWILAGNFYRLGYTWEAVGAYNAACTRLKGAACQAARQKYARCVYRKLPAPSRQPVPGPAPGRFAPADAAHLPILSVRVAP